MTTLLRFFSVSILAIIVSGCFLTKIITVPVRVVGGVGSSIPIVGGVIGNTLDTTADLIDDIPL